MVSDDAVSRSGNQMAAAFDQQHKMRGGGRPKVGGGGEKPTPSVGITGPDAKKPIKSLTNWTHCR
jgi:hypothetical protein